jgi:hypothetical protein
VYISMQENLSTQLGGREERSVTRAWREEVL